MGRLSPHAWMTSTLVVRESDGRVLFLVAVYANAHNSRPILLQVVEQPDD